jgi:hypothetical protein
MEAREVPKEVVGRKRQYRRRKDVEKMRRLEEELRGLEMQSQRVRAMLDDGDEYEWPEGRISVRGMTRWLRNRANEMEKAQGTDRERGGLDW